MKQQEMPIMLDTPADFHFGHALDYLNRYESECLHRVEGSTVYKALRCKENNLLLAVELGDGEEPAGSFKRPGESRGCVAVRFLNGQPEGPVLAEAISFVREWLDLDTSLEEFYALSATDHLLAPVVRRFRGLRLIGVPSLLEALCWTVIGQQINLSFAYTLKRRLVETFGTWIIHEGREFRLFPEAALLASLKPEQLQELKFSRVKAEALLRIARLIAEEELSKEQLLNMGDFGKAREHLISIRGIGPWTANYVAMRCLRDRDAFPLADVGLHHAIRRELELPQKPPLAQIEELSAAWKPWRAYATFYLWSTLTT